MLLQLNLDCRYFGFDGRKRRRVKSVPNLMEPLKRKRKFNPRSFTPIVDFTNSPGGNVYVRNEVDEGVSFEIFM